MKTRICTLGALLVLALPLAAVAGEHGVRLSYVTLPTDIDLEVRADTGETMQAEAEAHHGQRLGLMYTWLAHPEQPVSLTLGIGLDMATVRLDVADEKLTGLRGEAGASFRVTPALRVDTTVVLAGGSARIVYDPDPVSTPDDEGHYLEYGLVVRPTYRFDCGFSLGLEAGYATTVSTYDIEGGTGELTRTGFNGGLTAGYSFR